MTVSTEFVPNRHLFPTRKQNGSMGDLMRGMNNFSCQDCAKIAAYKSTNFTLDCFEYLLQYLKAEFSNSLLIQF